MQRGVPSGPAFRAPSSCGSCWWSADARRTCWPGTGRSWAGGLPKRWSNSSAGHRDNKMLRDCSVSNYNFGDPCLRDVLLVSRKARSGLRGVRAHPNGTSLLRAFASLYSPFLPVLRRACWSRRSVSVQSVLNLDHANSPSHLHLTSHRPLARQRFRILPLRV